MDELDYTIKIQNIKWRV